MKCLVTGGGGFLGSSVVSNLILQGHEVVALGRSNASQSISAIVKSNIEFIMGDVRDESDVKAAVKSCDHIYHFAGIVNSDVANGLSIDAIETEIRGLQNICQAALEEKVQKIIYASSCSVYGDEKLSAALTEDSPIHPISHYAVLKRMGELYLSSYQREHELDHIILRVFNPYGATQPTNMAMHRFFEAAINNTDLQIYGAGNQTRDFIYVDDVANAAIVAANIITGSETLNVCTGQDRSIKTVAETIIEMTGSSSDCKFLPVPSGRREAEISRSFGSIAKLQTLTGFTPTIGLEDGLKLMYEEIATRK